MFGSPAFDLTAALVSIASAMAAWIYRRRRSVARAVGTRIGPYAIVRKLGEGGMGSVYEARHVVLGRRSALKLRHPDRRGPGSAARFGQEARLTSELSHPNTVQLYDFGRTPDGVEYFAMELVDGLTLHDLVARHGPQPADRVWWILRQVASSLAQAHRAGLVHRDVKPANVMVCHRDGFPDCVKVLDFGLAKEIVPRRRARLSAPHVRIGTPAFMAPEASWEPARVGPSTDVYAAGSLAYFLLTGGPPFDAAGTDELALAHRAEPPLPPSLRMQGDLPADLERVVMRCLAKQPARRFRDGAALLAALDRCDGARGWAPQRAEQWWVAHPMGASTAGGVPPASPTLAAGTSATHPFALRRPKAGGAPAFAS